MGRETVETVRDFIFGGSKITADGDCSHEIIIPVVDSCWYMAKPIQYCKVKNKIKLNKKKRNLPTIKLSICKKKKKTLTPWKKSYDQPRQHIKKQKHYFADKGLSSQGYGFSSSHVWMWVMDYKESWMPQNWCFFNYCVGEDSWESLGLQRHPTSLS